MNRYLLYLLFRQPYWRRTNASAHRIDEDRTKGISSITVLYIQNIFWLLAGKKATKATVCSRGGKYDGRSWNLKRVTILCTLYTKHWTLNTEYPPQALPQTTGVKTFTGKDHGIYCGLFRGPYVTKWQYIYIWYDIFVKCNWVNTRWQCYSTHNQYIEQHNNNRTTQITAQHNNNRTA